MMRKALAALLLSMLVLVGASTAASAGDRDDSTCATYSHSNCKPEYPPKPPKPDKPHKPPTHKPPTHKPSKPTTSKPSTPTSSKSTTKASSSLARTGADNSVPLLAIGGGLIVVGAAAYGVSRLRRQS